MHLEIPYDQVDVNEFINSSTNLLFDDNKSYLENKEEFSEKILGKFERSFIKEFSSPERDTAISKNKI